MKNFFVFTIIFISVVSTFGQESELGSPEPSIVKIKPANWKPSARCPKIPKQIVRYLEKQNCTIPQLSLLKNHHNAFQGEFVTVGQFDWAILCSSNENSSIFMFWNSSTENVSQFASYSNKDFMTPKNADGKTGFTRVIGKDRLTKLSRADEILFRNIFSNINYWGIDEQLPDGKFVVYYMYEKQLLILENTAAYKL